MKDLFLDIVINRSKTVADKIRRLYLQQTAILDRTDVNTKKDLRVAPSPFFYEDLDSEVLLLNGVFIKEISMYYQQT